MFTSTIMHLLPLLLVASTASALPWEYSTPASTEDAPMPTRSLSPEELEAYGEYFKNYAAKKFRELNSSIIPGMNNGAAIALLVVLGCAMLAVPIMAWFCIRRRKRSNGTVATGGFRTDSRVALVSRRSSRRDSTDSFRDEIKRPERVMSFKQPWERERGQYQYEISSSRQTSMHRYEPPRFSR